MTDDNIVDKIIENPNLLKYMNKEDKEKISNNRDAIIKFERNNINLLQYIDKNKIDKEIILEAIKSNVNAILFANDEMLDDEEVIIEAIKKDGDMLNFASNRLKNNKEFIKKAISINKDSYKHISDEYKDDKEILKIIDNDENLIRLYGKDKKSNVKIKFEQDYNERGEIYVAYRSVDIDGNITIKDFIEQYFSYWINWYYIIVAKAENESKVLADVFCKKGRELYYNLFIENSKIKDLFNGKKNIVIECFKIHMASKYLEDKGIKIKDSYLDVETDEIDNIEYRDVFYRKRQKNEFEHIIENDITDDISEDMLKERKYTANIDRIYNLAEYFYNINDERSLLCYKEVILRCDVMSKFNMNYKHVALYQIGRIYYIGIGVENDYELAYKIFEELYRKYRNIFALSYIAEMYYFGYYLEKSEEKAMAICEYIITKSGSEKTTYAKELLALIKYQGKNKDYETVYKLCVEILESNKYNYRANFILGNLYLFGIYVEKDYEKSLEMFKRIEDKDIDGTILGYIGSIYGKKEDGKKMILYLKKSSEKGNIVAKILLSELYCDGIEGLLEKDEEYGKKLLEEVKQSTSKEVLDMIYSKMNDVKTDSSDTEEMRSDKSKEIKGSSHNTDSQDKKSDNQS